MGNTGAFFFACILFDDFTSFPMNSSACFLVNIWSFAASSRLGAKGFRYAASLPPISWHISLSEVIPIAFCYVLGIPSSR